MNTEPLRKLADHAHAATIGLLDGIDHQPGDYTPTHATEHTAAGTYHHASKAGRMVRKHTDKARAMAASRKSRPAPDAEPADDATVSATVGRATV